MKFPRIVVLLILFFTIIHSCRETTSKPKKSLERENSAPSTEKQRPENSAPGTDHTQPNQISRDSIIENQPNPRSLDTLKPKVAMRN